MIHKAWFVINFLWRWGNPKALRPKVIENTLYILSSPEFYMNFFFVEVEAHYLNFIAFWLAHFLYILFVGMYLYWISVLRPWQHCGQTLLDSLRLHLLEFLFHSSVFGQDLRIITHNQLNKFKFLNKLYFDQVTNPFVVDTLVFHCLDILKKCIEFFSDESVGIQFCMRCYNGGLVHLSTMFQCFLILCFCFLWLVA